MWVHALQWAGGRIRKAKYRMPKTQRPDGTDAGTPKGRLEVLPAENGPRSHRTIPTLGKARSTALCWQCQGPTWTREHRFKIFLKWKEQQHILWAEVRKATGGRKSRRTIRGLLTHERCSQAVTDILAATDVGRLVPAVEGGAAGSGVLEWELQERQEREVERAAEAQELGAAGELGAGEELPLLPPTPSFMESRDEG